MGSLFQELKRRNVFKVGIVYAIVVWLLIQVADVVLPTFNAPGWVMQVSIFFTLLGFPIALILAWAYEMTPEGIKSTNSVESEESITKLKGRKLDFAIIGFLSLSVVFLVIDNYVLKDETGVVSEETIQPTTNEIIESAPIVVEEAKREVLPNSVAVLPFENLSPNPNDAYFAAGIHEEILNQLAKVHGLNVISRTSVLNPDFTNGSMSSPEIAQALNVATLMEGSVRYARDKTVRVTAQLIDGETNTHLWTDTFDGDLTDIFKFQTEIAIQIAFATHAELSADDRQRIDKPITNSPEAHALYLKARALFPLESFNQPPEYYQYLDQAIALDPDFALAHAVKAIGYGLSIRFDIQMNGLTFAEMGKVALEHTEQALALDPNLAMAQMAQAGVHYNNQHGALARQAFERALQLSPNGVEILAIYARTLTLLGDFNEAVRLAQRAVALTPNNPENQSTLAGTLFYAGNPVAAAENFRKVVDLTGENRRVLGAVEFVLGNKTEALAELRLYEELADINAGWSAVYSDGVAQLAYQYARLGLQEDALRLFNNLEARAAEGLHIATSSWAISHLAIGEIDKAYQLLGQTEKEWSLYSLRWIKSNILNDPVLEEPRFIELRSRMGVID